MRTTARRVVSSLLALTLLSTAGLSQVMRPPRGVARSVATAPLDSAEQDFRAAAARHEPIELSVRDDVRERCRTFTLPPEPYVIESPFEGDADAIALAGLLACLREGPLAGRELALIGPTEQPGRNEYPAQTSAPADVARELLSSLGVPFERMVTRDVALDPLVSQHAAMRVVLALDQD